LQGSKKDRKQKAKGKKEKTSRLRYWGKRVGKGSRSGGGGGGNMNGSRPGGERANWKEERGELKPAVGQLRAEFEGGQKMSLLIDRKKKVKIRTEKKKPNRRKIRQGGATKRKNT